MEETLRYWVGFNLVRGVGPVRLRRLLQVFGDVASAWTATEAALRASGLDERALRNLLKVRAQVDLDQVLQKATDLGVKILTWESPAYPTLLAQLPDAPPVLYLRGECLQEDEWTVAVVGTRKASAYGQQVAYRLVSELASNGLTIVSGLARGIDSIAHRAAIEAGGRTIAVLGSGVDHIYPPEHRRLAQAITEHGALVSDYPLGTRPEASNFPPRNRIISGLSLATIVIEAGLKSGALITADFALDQGREVFAVPGSILSPSSAGCNRLLRDGAHVLTEARDVFEVLHLGHVEEKRAAQMALPKTPTERAVFAQLSTDPQHVDDLARAAELPVATVSGALVLMELKGLVRQVGPLTYVRAFEPPGQYQVNDSVDSV